jgi:hypothetical protein
MAGMTPLRGKLQAGTTARLQSKSFLVGGVLQAAPPSWAGLGWPKLFLQVGALTRRKRCRSGGRSKAKEIKDAWDVVAVCTPCSGLQEGAKHKPIQGNLQVTLSAISSPTRYRVRYDKLVTLADVV